MNWCQFKDPVSHMCLSGASILVSNTGVGGFEPFKWQIFLSLNALKTSRKINVSRFVTYQSYLVTRINAHSHGWPVQKLSFFVAWYEYFLCMLPGTNWRHKFPLRMTFSTFLWVVFQKEFLKGPHFVLAGATPDVGNEVPLLLIIGNSMKLSAFQDYSHC